MRVTTLSHVDGNMLHCFQREKMLFTEPNMSLTNSLDSNPLDHVIWGGLQQTAHHPLSFASLEELKWTSITARQKLLQSSVDKIASANGVNVRSVTERPTHRIQCSFNMKKVKMLTFWRLLSACFVQFSNVPKCKNTNCCHWSLIMVTVIRQMAPQYFSKLIQINYDLKLEMKWSQSLPNIV